MSHRNKIYFWTTCENTWSTIYLYAWRSKRSCSWMRGHIHDLMIVVKSKGSWTVRCMCTLRSKCACACMSIWFVDLVLTCVLALTAICFLKSTWLDVHLLLRSHLLKFTYFYVHILCWSYTSMFPCFDNRILLCQHTLKRTCSLSYMP